MVRVKNWSVKLRDFAVSHMGEEFVWGETDCVSFARECMKVMTGEDVLEPEIPQNWTTEIGAMRAYKKMGTFGEALERLGFVEAQVPADGDLIVSPGEAYENMGVVAGAKVFTASATNKRIEVGDKMQVPEEATIYRLY